MSSRLGERAIVIGGSMAGLMSARVLADHLEQVTVLERDHIEDHPAIHKSIPQGNHLHALLLSGEQVLSRLYPGFADKLQNLGAVRLRWAKTTPSCFRTARLTHSAARSGSRATSVSMSIARAAVLFEYCGRQYTLVSANCEVSKWLLCSRTHLGKRARTGRGFYP